MAKSSLDRQKVKKKVPNFGFHEKTLFEKIKDSNKLPYIVTFLFGLTTGVLIDFFDAQAEIKSITEEVCADIMKASKD